MQLWLGYQEGVVPPHLLNRQFCCPICKAEIDPYDRTPHRHPGAEIRVEYVHHPDGLTSCYLVFSMDNKVGEAVAVKRLPTSKVKRIGLTHRQAGA